MSKKVDLKKLSPQELLAYPKILLNRKKVNPCQNPNQSNLSQLNHLQNYHKFWHHPAKYLIPPKKLYR